MTMWEDAFGPFLFTSDGAPRPITRRDVQAAFGLSTNVITKSRAHFKRHLVSEMEREAEGRCRVQAKEAA